MIPVHCADVGVEEVSFSLSEENLCDHFVGSPSFTRTKFYAVTDGENWAVIQILKTRDRNLFQKIDDITLLSEPDRTSFVREPNYDVLDIGNMLRAQARHLEDLVIVQGRFDQISFIDIRLPAEIRIIDVVPPSPPKLEILLEDLLGDALELLDIDERRVNLSDLIADVIDDTIMLPCRATYEDLRLETGNRKLLFLDQAPELSDGAKSSMALIGCSLSERIFKEIYGEDPRLINMCVRETIGSFAEDDIPTISRCCKVKEGVEIVNKAVFVPWGAGLCEVAEALRIALTF